MSSSDPENSGSSERGRFGVDINIALQIHPRQLEQRYWARRCKSRLSSLDWMFEVCNAVMWLSILPSLQGTERTSGKAQILVAVAQLGLMHLTPALWLAHRSAFITGSQVLRCVVLLPWQLLDAPAPLTARLAASPDTPFSTLMMLLSGLWSHLLLVLFHQQPITIQAPLLAASTLVQGLQVISSPIQQTGLHAISAGLNWAFEQLVTGLLGSVATTSGSSSEGSSASSPETGILATVLFLHLFGGFLLPAFIAFILEWKLKIGFLLCECSSQAMQLKILTPAAAVARGSVLLSALLYLGWLLLMAVSSWVVCSTAAILFTIVPAGR